MNANVSAARPGGVVRLALLVVVAVCVAFAAASVLLPTSVGRFVADIWIAVVSAIGQLLGG